MSNNTNKYQLLDSGNFLRLEQAGPYRIVRPAAAAVWAPTLPEQEWKSADILFRRTGKVENEQVRGEWIIRNPKAKLALKESWPVQFNNIHLLLKLTSFGHLGLFAEQEKNWHEIHDLIAAKKSARPDEPVRILNLFAYTGAATLFAAAAGAEVVHLDASKGTVKWGRENSEASQLADRPIRWIVDDAQEFVKKELRRGNQYHGILLDPPTYGRGHTGEVWKIEQDLLPFLNQIMGLFADDFLFLMLSSHSPGYTPVSLENILRQVTSSPEKSTRMQSGRFVTNEMTIIDSTGKALPSGANCLLEAAEN